MNRGGFVRHSQEMTRGVPRATSVTMACASSDLPARLRHHVPPPHALMRGANEAWQDPTQGCREAMRGG
jgi:hypothetical protein